MQQQFPKSHGSKQLHVWNLKSGKLLRNDMKRTEYQYMFLHKSNSTNVLLLGISSAFKFFRWQDKHSIQSIKEIVKSNPAKYTFIFSRNLDFNEVSQISEGR